MPCSCAVVTSSRVTLQSISEVAAVQVMVTEVIMTTPACRTNTRYITLSQSWKLSQEIYANITQQQSTMFGTHNHHHCYWLKINPSIEIPTSYATAFSARVVRWLDHSAPCAVERDVRCVPLVRGSIRAADRVRRIRLRKNNYVKIIPTHMMIGK